MMPRTARGGRPRGRRPPGPGSMNVSAPAGCWVQHVHNCLFRVEIARAMVWSGPPVPHGAGPCGATGRAQEEPGARPSPVGMGAQPDRGGRDREVRAVLVRARARGPA
jgi:hypothetical protein